MKLLGNIAVHVKGEEILRRPRLWEKVKRTLGGEPDLRTGKMRAALEAEAVVDAVRDALGSLGATNAVSLVIDDLVLFQDKEGRADDLGDLFLAFHDNSSALGAGFGMLRLAVEHVEAGLHLVIEAQARTEHAASEPALRVIISGRLDDLEPRKGEDAAAYRARVEPLTADKTAINVATAQFESFVARVKDAIAASMPEARAQVTRAEAQIVRPGGKPPDNQPQQPEHRNYDPYMAYYPSPMYSMLDAMMWVSIFSMMSFPNVMVVNHHGDTVGSADTPNIEHADPSGVDGTVGNDQGDTGMGDELGGSDTGDFGSGDFGGGDVSGFD